MPPEFELLKKTKNEIDFSFVLNFSQHALERFVMRRKKTTVDFCGQDDRLLEQ